MPFDRALLEGNYLLERCHQVFMDGVEMAHKESLRGTAFDAPSMVEARPPHLATKRPPSK